MGISELHHEMNALVCTGIYHGFDTIQLPGVTCLLLNGHRSMSAGEAEATLG